MLSDQRQVAYGANRYTNEVHRLYGVLDKRLEGRDFICGDYSIADMASWPWTEYWQAHAIDIEEFPRVKAWRARVAARPAVDKAMKMGSEMRRRNVTNLQDRSAEAEAARRVMFGQRARK